MGLMVLYLKRPTGNKNFKKWSGKERAYQINIRVQGAQRAR